MKTSFTNVKQRQFFQLQVSDDFKKKLIELANSDGVSASGELRMLVNREHSKRFNGNGHNDSEVPNEANTKG